MTFPTERPRRLRQSPAWRRVVRETRLSPEQLIYPLFVVPGENVRRPVSSMPGVFQVSIDQALPIARQAQSAKIGGLLLFGVPEHKDAHGSAAADPNGLTARAIRALKRETPDLLLWADVCLCSATSHGHCGLVTCEGVVDNDASLEVLAAIAQNYAAAGADAVAPSDMMDGRVAAIRARLDAHAFSHVPIVSYAAKYASSLYGPFREAAESTPQFGDRKTYQMDVSNRREAAREIRLDQQEGADIVMIKPAGLYLDVIADAKAACSLPIAAYQVSGEYSMIKAAAQAGWIDERGVVLESLTAVARAGADIIVTYFAIEAAAWLRL